MTDRIAKLEGIVRDLLANKTSTGKDKDDCLHVISGAGNPDSINYWECRFCHILYKWLPFTQMLCTNPDCPAVKARAMLEAIK